MIKHGYQRLALGLGMTALIVGSLAATSSRAEDASRIPLTQVNLPYLHYFGFGAFRVGDEDVWVLRGSWKPMLRDHTGRSFGIAARFTGSAMGVQSRTIEDELQSIGIAGFTAGIEFRFPVTERSLIRTYTDWGFAFDVERDGEAGLGILGALGEAIWPWKGMELGLQPSVDLSGSATSLRQLDDALLAVQLRGDVRRYLGFHIAGERAQAGLYTDVSKFWGDTGLDMSSANVAFADTQFEVGGTFGTHEKFSVFGFRPLLNLGFRWGRDFQGIRIGFGDRVMRLPAQP